MEKIIWLRRKIERKHVHLNLKQELCIIEKKNNRKQNIKEQNYNEFLLK